MATPEEIASLRRMVDQPANEEPYTDEVLSDLIDSSVSLDAAAGQVWQEKAAAVWELVNTSESGSSRSLSDIHKAALAQAKFYRDASSEVAVLTSDAPFTVDIERS